MNFTFENLPSQVHQLSIKIDNINKMLLDKKEQQLSELQDQWFSLDDLIKYDPANRKKPTWYSIVSRGEVPYHKNGKNLVFLKSEIDEWLKSGRQKSNAEIEAEARSYLKKKGGIND